ncbi:hypothetical protein D9M70_409190 [compost metagenome]
MDKRSAARQERPPHPGLRAKVPEAVSTTQKSSYSCSWNIWARKSECIAAAFGADRVASTTRKLLKCSKLPPQR